MPGVNKHQKKGYHRNSWGRSKSEWNRNSWGSGTWDTGDKNDDESTGQDTNWGDQNSSSSVPTSLAEIYGVSKDVNSKGIFYIRSEEPTIEFGPGNLSFSICLSNQGKASYKYTVVSYDTQAQLEEKYGYVDMRIKYRRLEAKGIKLVYGVSIQDYVPEGESTFSKVLFNFPHGGVEEGKTDKHPRIQQKCRILIEEIFSTSYRIMSNGGILILTLLSNQFRNWHVKKVAEESSFVLAGVKEFCGDDYPAYQNVYGDLRSTRGMKPKRVSKGGRDGYDKSDQQKKSLTFAFRLDLEKKVETTAAAAA
eukprot:gene562-6_t